MNTISKTINITKTQHIIMTNKELVNKHWLLLDNQSTVHIFKSKYLLSNVKKSDETIRCYCNGGYQDTEEIGEIEGIGDVYCNSSSLANIISYGLLGESYRITSDIWKEDAFTMNGFMGRDIKFIRSDEGLYYHDVRWDKTGVPNHLLESIQCGCD